MALVSCPECQKEVSTHALACPQCALPFPGKQARGVGQAGTKLHACPDCGCPVSKQAQTCPHCGVTLEGEQRSLPTNRNFVEETWLCTHCGTPYTRKVRQEKELVADIRMSSRPVTRDVAWKDSWSRDLSRRPSCRLATRDVAWKDSWSRYLSRRPSCRPAIRDVAWKDSWSRDLIRRPSSRPATRDVGVERLLEPVPQQETVVPTSNTGRSVERLLEPGPHQETVVPTGNTGRSVERLLEPGPQQETVVPTSNTGRSVERLLEPVPQQETVVPDRRNTGRSGTLERLLEPGPQQETVVPTSTADKSLLDSSGDRRCRPATRDVAWKDPWSRYPIRSRGKMFRHLHDDGLSFGKILHLARKSSPFYPAIHEAEKSLSFWDC